MNRNCGKRYRMTFQFVETEADAIAFCDGKNAMATPYARKHHPAHYTPWSDKFVCFYYE